MRTQNSKIANAPFKERMRAAGETLSAIVNKKVRMTVHGFERLDERFSGSFSDSYIIAIREAIALLDVMWMKKKVRVEKEGALVVLARNGNQYSVVTAWDPRLPKA